MLVCISVLVLCTDVYTAFIMKSIFEFGFVVAVLAVAVTPVRADDKNTPVEQCPDESFENLRDRVQVIPCEKTPCKLQQNSNITVVFKFAPRKEVKNLFNDVFAVVAGIPFPFLGVTGTNACEHVVHAATGAPAACPLAPGHEYVYTNMFPVLAVYPRVSMRVHWSLADGHDTVLCFEFPAIITRRQ